jgi:hypothetical protein
MTIKISVFSTIATATVSEVLELPSLEALVQALPFTQARCTAADCASLSGTKKCAYRDSGAWSPATFAANQRSKQTVEAVHSLVYDVDKISTSAAVALRESVEKSGLSAYMMTTHSHNPAKNSECWRVIIEIDRPLLPAEWSWVHPAVAAQLQFRYDPATRTDSSRAFFKPTFPTNTVPVQHLFKGAPLKVDSVQVTPATADLLVELPEPTSNDVDMLTEILKNTFKGELKILLKRGLTNQPFAMPGSRDNTVFKFFTAVAREAPDITWDTIAHLFGSSLRGMGANKHGIPYMEVAREKWTRGRESLLDTYKESKYLELKREASQANQSTAMVLEQKTLCEKIRGSGKGTYTPEEMIRWAQENNFGNSVESFLEHQIIEYKDSYYFLVEGKYTTPTWGNNFNTLAREYLQLSNSDIFVMDKSGRHLKDKAALLEQYGRPAVHVRASLAAQRSQYITGRESLFIEALAPISPAIKPVRHEHVIQWLELLGGPQKDKLFAWVAAVTKLDLQCSAIFLCGARGVGKTLFANGISKIWGGQPTEMASVMSGDFNAQVASCPLLFADEEAPRVTNLMVQIRKLTGQPNFYLKRKFLADTQVDGCVRLVFAANDYKMLETAEELSVQDAEAIAQRFLLVEPQKAAADFIVDLKSNPDAREGMVKGTHIAETALWLRDNHTYERGSRFEVEGESTDLTRHLLCHSGSHSKLLEYMCLVLSEQNLDQFKKYLRFENGRFLVNAGAFTKALWEAKMTFVPSASKVGSALANLSAGPQETIDGTPYFPLVSELIIYFSRVKQVGHLERITERLAGK